MVKKQSLLSCSFSSASGKLCASESSWLQTSILMTLFTSDLFSNFPQRWQATKFRLLHLLIRSGKRCETTHCVRCNSNLEFSFVAKRVQRKSFYNTRDMDVLYISIDSLSHDSFSKFMQIMGKKTSILAVCCIFCHYILIFAGHHVHAYTKENQVSMLRCFTREEISSYD
jgi:hypothetical protein